MAIALVAVLVAIPGIKRIEVVSDPLAYFQESSSHRAGAEFIRDNLAGTGIVNVVMQTKTAGSVLEPAALQAMDDVLAEVDSLAYVDRTTSFLDYIELIDGALRPGEPARRVLPSRELAAQYMLLYEAGGDPADYRHYINYERSGMNAFVRSRSLGSTDVLEIQRIAEKHSKAAGDDEDRLEPVREELIELAPAGSDFLAAVRLRLDRLLPVARVVAKAVGPITEQSLEQYVSVPRDMGMDIEREVLNSLSGEALVFNAPVHVPGLGFWVGFWLGRGGFGGGSW